MSDFERMVLPGDPEYKIPPGHPEYDREIERIRFEMLSADVNSFNVDAYIGALYESSQPVLSNQTLMERRGFSPVLADDTGQQIFMNLHDKGLLSGTTLLEKIGISYDEEVERMRWEEANMSVVAASTSVVTGHSFLPPGMGAVTTSTATGATSYGYATSTSNSTTATVTISFSGGYVIGYGQPAIEEPKVPKQWRGTVHGRVRFE